MPDYQTTSDPWTFEYGFQTYAVPDYMRQSVIDYIEKGYMPGEFLYAVLINDLHTAIGRADHNNIGNLPAYVNYLHNHAPRDCWGSKEAVKAWLAKFRRDEQ